MAADAVAPHGNCLECLIPVTPATPNATPWLRQLSISPANYIFIAIYQYSYADLMPLCVRQRQYY
jgi:hypothetical protein